MLGIVLPWFLGVLCVHQLPGLPDGLWVGATAVAALWALGCQYARWLVWALAGFWWTAWHVQARLDDQLADALVGENLEVSGWVDSFPRPAPGQVTFSLRTLGAGMPGRLRLTWYDPEVAVEPGTGLKLIVRLKQPRGLANPGGFDYERWLLTEAYGATGYVVAAEVARQPMGPARWWLGLRARLARRIDQAAPSADSSALLTALVMGERYRFTDAHWSGFRRTGTSHLVAISGLHVGLVAGLTLLFARRLWRRLPMPLAHYDMEAAALASFLCAAGYAALAGFSLPTQRALLMLSVALTALTSRRRLESVSGLAAALFVVLLWDPLAPLSTSFWLSFLAVALLWQLVQQRPLYIDRSPIARVGDWIRIQWGITVGLVPVLAIFFTELSLISPLVNFIAIPFFSIVLVPLILLASLSLALPGIGSIAMFAIGRLAEGAWLVLDAAGAQPWAAMALPALSPWLLFLAGAAAILGVPAHGLPGRRIAWLAMLPLLLKQTGAPEPGVAKVTVLDVGHGLAVLVQTHQHSLLYDAGPRYRSGFDSGEEIVLPAMLANGWTDLDRVVISHADNDHAGGMAAVLDAYPDASLLTSFDVMEDGRVPCRAEQAWVWDEVVFTVLHPGTEVRRSGNDGSCVLQVSTRAGALLLTGDIEVAGERALLERHPQIPARVVVVPHHGSNTSSSADLVLATEAELALVSAAYGNRWGFPKPEVVERWEGAGARVMVTGEMGAITVTLGGSDELEVTTERGKRRRFWQSQGDSSQSQE